MSAGVTEQQPARPTYGEALAQTTTGNGAGGGYAIAPSTFTELQAFCGLIASSDFAPNDFKGKPGNILIAVQMGAELGLKPMQSLQNIAVINGRPAVWGDAALALVRSRHDCQDVDEGIEGTGETRFGFCVVTRRGSTPVRRTFSVADARLAGLWNKNGPWKTYPDRMLQLRARGFAIRDAFPDALKGFILAEEAQDMPTDEPTSPAAGAPPPAPAPNVRPSRTDNLAAKIATNVQLATAPANEVVDAEFTEGGGVDPDQLKVDLIEGIRKGWNGQTDEILASALVREFGRTKMDDLNVTQLQDFLERTPELIAQSAA